MKKKIMMWQSAKTLTQVNFKGIGLQRLSLNSEEGGWRD